MVRACSLGVLQGMARGLASRMLHPCTLPGTGVMKCSVYKAGGARAWTAVYASWLHSYLPNATLTTRECAAPGSTLCEAGRRALRSACARSAQLLCSVCRE